MAVGVLPLEEATVAADVVGRGEHIVALGAPPVDFLHRGRVAGRGLVGRAEGGTLVLYGNLAPNGAVIKHTAASPHLLEHRGPAYVFDDHAAMVDELERDDLPVDENSVLILRNAGPALTVGLSPYTLQQDLNVSLGGGGLSVGARLGGVALRDSESDPAEVPESSSGVLLLSGGALLCALSRLRKSRPSRGA